MSRDSSSRTKSIFILNQGRTSLTTKVSGSKFSVSKIKVKTLLFLISFIRNHLINAGTKDYHPFTKQKKLTTKFNDCKSESKHLEQIIYELYEVFIAKEYAFQQAKTQKFGKNPSSS